VSTKCLCNVQYYIAKLIATNWYNFTQYPRLFGGNVQYYIAKLIATNWYNFTQYARLFGGNLLNMKALCDYFK